VIPVRWRTGILLVLFIFGLLGDASAGTQTIRDKVYDFRQIAVLSKALERALAARRAWVAVIARVCLKPELLPPGVRFSHAGFAVYSRIETGDGRLVPGYAVYSLYQGAERTGRSYLAQDYPVDYLAVSQRLVVGVVIPNEKLQRALLRTIFSESYRKLHNPRYSVLSNPFNAMYQNCTEFVLDVLFASIYRTDDVTRLKANIAAYFEPHPIEVDPVKLQYAASTMADVHVDDHTGPIATVTFPSIARFLLEYGIAEEAFTLSADPTTLYTTIETLEF
jgi:hypothetical protein